MDERPFKDLNVIGIAIALLLVIFIGLAALIEWFIH